MNRTTLIIVFAVGLVAIGGFIGILTGALRGPGDTANDNTTVVTNRSTTNAFENPSNVSTTVEPGLDESPVSVDALTDAELATREAIKTQARVFTATYGTYSNQNSNEQLVVLLDQTTTPLKAQFEQAIKATKNAPVGEYHGFTTTVVSADVRALTGVTATVVVTTMRLEQFEDKADRSFDQAITLIFKNSNGTWLVGEADWQAED